MAIVPFTYLPSQQVRKDLTYGRFDWRTAEDQYKAGKYLEALISTVRYIDEEAGQTFAKDPATGVKVSHSSMQMYITVNNGQLQVLAPFVSIENAQKLIVLRRICEINFDVLQLARIECRENTLCFLFNCPLEACEPWKIYDVLKEICWIADKYDDEFIIKNSAAWVYEPAIAPFSDARKEASWNGLKQYLAEGLEWAQYWKGQNFPYVAWDSVYVTLMKIDHLCTPQGIVKNLLEQNINQLFAKIDINDLVADGIAYMQSLDKLPQSAFYTQLYDVSLFVPAKTVGSAASIQSSLKQSLTDAHDYLTKNNIIEGYLSVQKAVYRLLYNYRFNEVQWQHLTSLLSGLNGLPMADAANKLYTALTDFSANPRDQVTAPAPDKVEEKKSLFSSWFK